MTISTCPPPEGGACGGRGIALAGVAALSSLFLAACGGDTNDPAASPPTALITQVPASAAASDLALETFAFNLPETENTYPLTLELVPVLPTSETESPITLP